MWGRGGFLEDRALGLTRHGTQGVCQILWEEEREGRFHVQVVLGTKQQVNKAALWVTTVYLVPQDTLILNRCDSVCSCVNAELMCPCVLMETGPTLLGQKGKGHPWPPMSTSSFFILPTGGHTFLCGIKIGCDYS